MVISQTAVLILLTCVLANVEGKHGNNSFTITNWKAFSGFNCLRFLFSLFLPVHVWWVVFYCGYQRRPGWTGVSQPVTATGWPPSGCRTSPHGYKPPGWGTGGPDGWEDTEKNLNQWTSRTFVLKAKVKHLLQQQKGRTGSLSTTSCEKLKQGQNYINSVHIHQNQSPWTFYFSDLHAY